MLRCTFESRRVYCDFYFLLEMVGIAPYPAPHLELLRDTLSLAHLEGALARLRAAHVALGGDADGLFEEVASLEDHRQLLSLLVRIGVSRGEAVALIDAAVAGRTRVISATDAAACARLVGRADTMLRVPRVAAVLGALRAFLSIGPDDLPLTVTPYPLSSMCRVSFGSLTARLVTLGVHPLLEPERIIGIIVHEAVHAWLEMPMQPVGVGDAELRTLAEPLATTIGNGWVVQQLSGSLPGHAWYDDDCVATSARQLYPLIAKAISAGQRFESVAPDLYQSLSAGGES